MSQSTGGHHAYELEPHDQQESNVQTHTHSVTHPGWHGRRAKKKFIPKRNKNTFLFGWTAKRTNVYGSQTDEFFLLCNLLQMRWIFLFSIRIQSSDSSEWVCVCVYTFHVEHVKFVCHTTSDRICPFCYIGYKVQTHSEAFDGAAKRSHSMRNVIMTTTDKMSLGLA